MGGRNNISTAGRTKKEPRGYKVLVAKNAYLGRENKRLHQDNEQLREVFRVAAVEFEKRKKEADSLRTQLEQALSTIKILTEENAELKTRLETEEGKVNLLNKLVYGKRSEKRQQEQESEQAQHKKRGAVTGHKGRGRTIPKKLPVKNEVVDIPDDEKFCPNCGLPYRQTSMEETSSEICMEKVYYVKQIRRKVYKKTCACPNQIITAPTPGKLIPKGKFDTSFWVEVLLNKYKNHLPIERQVKDMVDYGLTVSNGTLFGGLKKIYLSYLEVLYLGLIESIRQAEHLHIDETGWKIFTIVDGKNNYRWFIWVLVSKTVVLFVLHPSRGAKVPCKILFDMDIEEARLLEELPKKKIRISVDKFSSYKTLERLGLVELFFCWSHQRREFLDMKTKYPQLAGWAEQWVKRIGLLFHINNQRIAFPKGSPEFKRHDARLRKKIEEIFSLLTANKIYKHQGQTAVINSMKEHWTGLTLFVTHPEVPMDNNTSERALKDPVLGRKNYWGNHTNWAGQLSVAMFSIVQTCTRNNISPRAYLSWYLNECIKKGAAPSHDEISSFLPHNLSPDIREKLKVCTSQETTLPA